jgi:hypothetical protein
MANVFTTVSSQAWATDKCRIATGNTAVTFNVDAIYPSNIGNLYSSDVSVPANWITDTYVGVGNKLTITGNNFTAQEVGTASSGSAGVL